MLLQMCRIVKKTALNCNTLMKYDHSKIFDVIMGK